MRRSRDKRRHLRVKSIDKIERVGPDTYRVEATFVEDDRPVRGRGKHRVRGHRADVDGRMVWVREHQARDPGSS